MSVPCAVPAADAVRLTVRGAVPEAIDGEIVPVSVWGAFKTVTTSGLERPILPAPSYASAWSVWVAFVSPVVSIEKL